MMKLYKKTFWPLILSAAMAISMAGCTNGEGSGSISQTGTSTITESTTEPIEYNGTFNEDVFNRIIQNIKIGDKTISLPCTLEDFGEGYKFGENPFYQKDVEIMSCDVLDKEDRAIAIVSFKCKEDDKDFTDNEITYIYFEEAGKANAVIGGLTSNDTKSNVLKNFGEPSKIKELRDETSSFSYEPSLGGYVRFSFDTNEKIIEMEISLKKS